MTETVIVQLIEPTTLVVTPQEATIVVSSPGPQGSAGTNGTNGTNGAAATITAGTTTTGAAGTNATVTNSGTTSAAVFNFTIPQGTQGTQGIQGTAGTNGTNGQGVVVGGTTGQALTKINATDYNTQWTTIPLLNTANTYTAAPQIVNTGADGNLGIVIRQNSATQSGNLFETQNAAGSSVGLTIDSTGNLTTRAGMGGSVSFVAGATGEQSSVVVYSYNGARIGMVIKGLANQTADLAQNKNSAGTVLSGVNGAGQIYAGATAGITQNGFSIQITATTFTSTTATYTYNFTSQVVIVGQTVLIAGVTPAGYNGTFVVQSVGGVSGAFTFTCPNTTNATVTVGTGNFRQSAVLSITAPNLYSTPVIIQGATSQAGNLTEWLNSTRAVVASMNSVGGLSVTNGILIGGSASNVNNNASQAIFNAPTNNAINTGFVQISARQSNQLPLVVKQATLSVGTITAATANGTTVTYTSSNANSFVVGQTITITGVVSTGNPSATPSAGFNLTSATIATATATQFTITNALVDTYTSGGTATIAAQSANLQEWQSSTSSVLASINPAGIFSGGIRYTGTNTNSICASAVTGQSLTVGTNAAASVGLVVRGSASQTGDLQQWTTNAGTAAGLLASITAAGVLVTNQPAPNAQTASSTLTVANLLTRIITSTSATAVALTLPTGTLMDGGFASLATDISFDWSVINLGSALGAVTITAGTAHTIVGSDTVAVGASAQFRSRRTAAATWVSYRIA
jgi:hypothetical protein